MIITLLYLINRDYIHMTDKSAKKLRKLPCVLHRIVMPVYQSIFKRNSPACYLKIVSAGGKKLVDIIPVINRHYLAPALIIGSVQREKLMAQLDKFFTICQRLCDNEQADVANELPEDTLVICYYGTDPHGNKMFYKNEDMVVPVFADVTVGLVIDSVGLAESEEKLDLWDTLGRYYIDSELMEFYDCDTKNLIFCNLTNSPIYVTIYESSAAMLCMPNTAKIASRKVKEK